MELKLTGTQSNLINESSFVFKRSDLPNKLLEIGFPNEKPLIVLPKRAVRDLIDYLCIVMKD